MARMVMLYFEDNYQAETLVEDMQRAPESDILTPSQENNVHAEVVGMYALPTKWCEHDHHTKGFGKFRIVTGRKYGWRLHWHGECNLPVRGSQIARNLIPKEERMDTTFHSDLLFYHNFKDDKYKPQPDVGGLVGADFERRIG